MQQHGATIALLAVIAALVAALVTQQWRIDGMEARVASLELQQVRGQARGVRAPPAQPDTPRGKRWRQHAHDDVPAAAGAAASPGGSVALDGDVEARIRQQVAEEQERSRTERRERWHEMRRESTLSELDEVTQQFAVAEADSARAAGLLEQWLDDRRAVWDQVHNGDLTMKDARDESESQWQALESKLVPLLGQEGFAVLEESLDYGHRRGRR